MAKYKIKFTLLLAVSLFLNIASAFADSEDRPVNVYVQQPRGPMDVIVHKAPPQAPTSEKLAYAQRLYDANDFSSAQNEVEPLCRDGNPEADQACYLLGRIVFSQGHEAWALGYFSDLTLRYPNSPLVKRGELSATLSRAVELLFDKHQWKLSGNYLSLLKQFSPSEVGRLGRLLESDLDRELQAYDAEIASYQMDFGKAVPLWEVSNIGNNGSISNLPLSCTGEGPECQPRVRQQAYSEKSHFEEAEYQRWSDELRPKFIAQKQKFSRMIYEKVQLYPLLKELMSQKMIQHLVLPRRFIAPPSPFVFSLHHYHYVSTDAWSASAEERMPKDGWALARQLDEEKFKSLQFPILKMEKPDRKKLLSLLGKLLNISSNDASKNRRRL